MSKETHIHMKRDIHIQIDPSELPAATHMTKETHTYVKRDPHTYEKRDTCSDRPWRVACTAIVE